MSKPEKSGCLPIILWSVGITCVLAWTVNLIMTGEVSPDDSPYTEKIAWLIYPILLVVYILYHVIKGSRRQEIKDLESKQSNLSSQTSELNAKRNSTLDNLRRIK